ncbi:type II secretion system protein [Aliarcobacter butzleri]|uniref:type IV pilin protein n=1 Tax=Aliarcobacter butzleri TaxID=28197 RepID=UPI00344BDE7D
MKKIVRKGFSMIELLFVMVILASLAAIAIPSMSASEESSILTSMRSDAQGAIKVINERYVENQEYIESGSFTDGADNDGKSSETLSDGETQLFVSKNNTISIQVEDCGTGEGTGFSVQVSNTQLSKIATYNSCTQPIVKIVDGEASAGYKLPEGHVQVDSNNLFLEEVSGDGVFAIVMDPDTGDWGNYYSLGTEKSMSDYNMDNFSISDGGAGSLYYEGEKI